MPFGQPEAEQRDAEHRRRRQGEVDAAGDHVISAHGDNADRAETKDASGTLWTSIRLIFCQLRK